uniref:Uncharacterized protein n=1 Tax=Pelusios castaneus TaxID=367368 RepID=A0A8C8SYF3_9SAUR
SNSRFSGRRFEPLSDCFSYLKLFPLGPMSNSRDSKEPYREVHLTSLGKGWKGAVRTLSTSKMMAFSAVPCLTADLNPCLDNRLPHWTGMCCLY